MQRAVIFDLDGTLIDSAVATTTILNRMRAARGLPPLDKKLARQWVSLGAAGLVTNGVGSDAASLKNDIDEFRRIYRALPSDPNELFPHVLETIAALAARGHKLGICTNKPEDLARPIIEGTGLGAHIKTVVGGRAGMSPKPDPAPLLETLRLMSAEPAQALYIGDSEVDAETAMAAKVPFYFVTFGYAIGDAGAIKADARIQDFRELPDLLTF